MGIGWHDLRHTYGSHLAMLGVALKVIQDRSFWRERSNSALGLAVSIQAS